MRPGGRAARSVRRDRRAAADRQAQGRDPGHWQQGGDVIIAGSVSDEEAKQTYPEGWEAPRPYIRIVRQPH